MFVIAQNSKLKSQNGFTLVELLVTLSIMAVIMGSALVAFGGTRATARDGKRRADLESVRSALELYRSDNGGYPQALATLVPTYTATVPADPNTPARVYGYTASNCGVTVCSSYTLCAALEVGGGTVAGCGSCGTACSYRVTNP